MTAHILLLIGGAVLGVFAAILWFWSTITSVTREQEVARRIREAAKKGEPANLAGISYNGLDPMATLQKQAKINAGAAFLTALAIIAQTASNFVK